MEQVRLGIIGIGNMGTAHANNIKDGNAGNKADCCGRY